ncbi:MAG: hypothetical protein GWN00_18675 [Aliifodinibius sp.]|nr:hypothetical protein [Fodinibius sp.]NIV13088.1 hypothetical protein [Fodinibius sp.]NIY26756.1 hypothetical protein [Fodinibius sp.]
MRPLKSFSLLFLLSLLLISCGSQVPIASIDSAIEDDRIVGAWLAKDSSGTESIRGVVYKLNETEYFIELREEEY